MNYSELITALEGNGCSQFVALRTRSQVGSALKSGFKLGKKKTAQLGVNEVWKVSYGQFGLFHIYQNAVNNQLEREGKERDFQPSPRKWGRRIAGRPLIEHNGKLYLEVRPLKSFCHSYYDENGNLLDAAEVEALMRPSSNKEHQGVEKEIFWRTYGLQSILAISLQNETHILGGEMPPVPEPYVRERATA